MDDGRSTAARAGGGWVGSGARRYLLSVCKGEDCRRGRSDDLFRLAVAEAERLGLGAGRCEVGRGGCYGLCQLGPNVVLRESAAGAADPLWPGHYRLLGAPGEFHYWRMDPAKLRRVLAEHVGEGRPAADLVCPPAGRRGEG